MNATNYTENTELLKLKLNLRNKLAQILDIDESWTHLAEVIPKNVDAQIFEPLYSAEEIRSFENQGRRNGSPTLVLLEDWSRRGQPRPTIKLLLKLLTNVKQHRATDFIKSNVLKLPSSSDSLQDTKSSTYESVTISNTDDLSQLSLSNQPTIPIRSFDSRSLDNEAESSSCKIDELITTRNSIQYNNNSNLQNDKNCAKLTLEYLSNISDSFNSVPYREGGRLLGEGAFGCVYLGELPDIGKVAIKKLKGNQEVFKQFETEVETLSKFRHENLLSLIGYCTEDHNCCLIYDFMCNGSLQDRLACKHETAPLSWSQRKLICLGTAKGINYLHNFDEKPLVHRDIKSANILLDSKFNPKVGDFGLARQGAKGSGSASTAVKTNVVFGTSVYMPREAFYGDISAKIDVFSFGIVLLELISGLSPYNQETEEDLLSFVNENFDLPDIADLIDPKLAVENMNAVVKMFKISRNCTCDSKNKRPMMYQIMPDLASLSEETN